MAFKPNVKLQIGEMSEKIAIEEATYTTNSFGEKEEIWSHYCYVWASIAPFKARERYFTEKWQFEDILVFTVRWQTGIHERQRISYDDGNGVRYYNIRGIERISRNRWLNIIAQYKG